MRILVDAREPPELIAHLKTLVDSNIKIETGNLDIGDFHIYKTNDAEIPEIIIERKSIKDLLASLKDGRYNEQSYRLDHYPIHNHNIYYIIEGSLEKISNPITKQTLYSSIFTLNHFKGFSTINSLNIKQTCEYIFRFSDKLQRENKRNSYYLKDQKTLENNQKMQDNKDPKILENNQKMPDNYSSVLKAAKKSNVTQDNIFEIMLMQIPNVSANVAQIISKKFKTMKNLISCLEENKNCLNGISISSTTNRKLSKATINNLISYILNEDFSLEIIL